MSENIKLNAWEAAEEIVNLRRENAALRAQDAYLVSTVDQLERENAALKIERNRLRVVLQDIADASGFDNIGNWARNKANDALRKETQPIRVDHSGDINEMMQIRKEAQS